MSCTDDAASSFGNVASSSMETGTGNAAAGNSTTSSTASSSDTGRNFVVDERLFEEQFLRCQICHERFDQSDRAPKSLPCNHTFCLPCLTKIFDHAQPPARRTLIWSHDTLDGTLKCPTCRVEIFLARDKIRDLPNDHRVVQMMDFLAQAVAKSQNVCSKHDGQPLNFFCKKCLIPVCRDCTVLDHKEHDGHTIVDLSAALNENAGQFNEIENNSRQLLEKMKVRSDCLANASKRLDILERRLKNEIKETFIEYRLLLEKRQEALTSMVHQIVHDQKAKVNAKFVYVCEYGTQLQKLHDEFKASRSSNDIRKLFSINQQMKDHDNNFNQIANQDDVELFQSCEFEAENEIPFLSGLSGLGEVRTKEDLELKKPISAHQLVFLDREERRERERFQENVISNEFPDDEFPSVSYDFRYLRDDAEDNNDEEEPQSFWPTHNAILSYLMPNYPRLPDDGAEAMDDGEMVALGNRRSRRGRRSRDTNSVQVQSSLSSDNADLLNFMMARPASTSSTTSNSGRSNSRNRAAPASTAMNYRVVRHPSSSTSRNLPTFGNVNPN